MIVLYLTVSVLYLTVTVLYMTVTVLYTTVTVLYLTVTVLYVLGTKQDAELIVCMGTAHACKLLTFVPQAGKFHLPTAQAGACLAEAACCSKLRRWTKGCRLP